MTKLYYALGIFFLLIITTQLSAQVTDSIIKQPTVIAIDSLLLKALLADELLPKLIDSAIKYSPSVNGLEYTIAYGEDNLKMNKNNIFNGIFLQSSYYYGTNISTLNSIPNNNSAGNTSNLSTAQSAFYNAGIGIQLPITQFINRKTIIHAGKSLVNISKTQKENAILLLKQEVIRLYQDFKLSQKLMVFNGKMKDFATINYNIAEKDFTRGLGSLEQLSKVQEVYAKTVAEYETIVSKFQTNLMHLETLTGTNINSLLNLVK